MSGVAEQALATLTDYVQRTTHWTEGGATRHDAVMALRALQLDLGNNPGLYTTMRRAEDLETQNKLLRRTLRLVSECLKGHDSGHIVVDIERPRVGLRQYINRVLNDTK